MLAAVLAFLSFAYGIAGLLVRVAKLGPQPPSLAGILVALAIGVGALVVLYKTMQKRTHPAAAALEYVVKEFRLSYAALTHLDGRIIVDAGDIRELHYGPRMVELTLESSNFASSLNAIPVGSRPTTYEMGGDMALLSRVAEHTVACFFYRQEVAPVTTTYAEGLLVDWPWRQRIVESFLERYRTR
jgi:hypothetical protein